MICPLADCDILRGLTKQNSSLIWIQIRMYEFIVASEGYLSQCKIMDNFEAINICKQAIQLVINVLKLLDCHTAVHLHTNVKPSLWNVAVFISTEQNGSYVIRQNNIKQRRLCIYYFLIKRKIFFGQPNTLFSEVIFLSILITLM